MRLIPGKTKVQIEIFKGVTLWDILVGAIAIILLVLILISSIPHKFVVSIVLGVVTFLLVFRMDEKPNYLMVLHMFRHISSIRRYRKVYDDEALKKKASGEMIEEYLEGYREEIKQKEIEYSEDPDNLNYSEDAEEEYEEEYGDYEGYEGYSEDADSDEYEGYSSGTEPEEFEGYEGYSEEGQYEEEQYEADYSGEYAGNEEYEGYSDSEEFEGYTGIEEFEGYVGDQYEKKSGLYQTSAEDEFAGYEGDGDEEV